MLQYDLCEASGDVNINQLSWVYISVELICQGVIFFFFRLPVKVIVFFGNSII